MTISESPRIIYLRELLESRNLSRIIFDSITDSNFEMVKMERLDKPLDPKDLNNQIPQTGCLKYELQNKYKDNVGRNYRLYILNLPSCPNEIRVALLRNDPTVKRQRMLDKWDQKINKEDLKDLSRIQEVKKDLTAFLKGCTAKDISRYEYYNNKRVTYLLSNDDNNLS